MDSFDTSFTSATKKKKQKKRIRNIILISVGVLLAAAAAVVVITVGKQDGNGTSTLSYRASAVSSGEISTVVSGSGTLSALDSQSVTTAAQSTVTSINYAPGDAIAAGDVVMTLSSPDLESQLSDLKDELSDTRSSLATTRQLLTNLKVTAPKGGIVKDVQAAEGSIVDDMDYLCLIATDGKMQVTIPLSSGVGLYDPVTVVVGDEEQSGYVTKIEDGAATIAFTDNYYAVGTSASVLGASGETLGTGTVGVNEFVEVTAASGKIATVSVTENKRVSKGRRCLFLPRARPPQPIRR
ncbi:MAG: hypothetical protein R2912_09635 [Eubacteriales bacterium]